MDIGFVGLGNMGVGMAGSLARAGHRVRGFDLSAAALDEARALGVEAAASAVDAVAGAAAVVTMLPAGAHVRAAWMGGMFAAARAGAALIDCSTIEPVVARELGEAATREGRHFVDAPVSGGVAAAAAGTLTFMVGGPEAAVAVARPVLDAMGNAVIHAGGPGAGQAAKICNNMLLAVTMAGTCEAFALARKLGLDDATFFDIARQASGQSWSLTSYCPVPGPVPSAPSNRDYEGGFAGALMLKDVRLALGAGREAGQALPVASAAAALYELYSAMGAGGRDFSGLLELLEGRLGRDQPASG